MPLFFFVSGFLFAYTTPKEKLGRLDLGHFYIKKIKRLLVPFFIFNTLFFIIKAALIRSEQMKHPVEMTYNSFVHYTFVSPVGYLWFLPTLFVIFIVFVPFMKYLSRCAKWRVSFFFLAVVVGGVFSNWLPKIFEVNRAFYFFPYFICGFLYCYDKVTVDKVILKYIDVTLPAFWVLSIIMMKKWSYMSGFTGIIFAISLSLVLLRRIGDYTVVFSRLTYTIFLLSYIPQMLIRGPIAHLMHVNQYILSCLSFVFGLIIPVFAGIFVLLQKDSRLWRKVKLVIGL